ncbi:MAG: hypothetical protein KGL95_13155, partial [Patescibacteria group bacterium]|nr:hypothetical protein [Patescibacteria group bacterium]
NLVAWQIVKDYFVSQAINLFRDDPTGREAFPKLDRMIADAREEQNEGKYKFLTAIRDEFQVINVLPVPSSLQTAVEGWNGELSPFPLFRQKYFAHEFAKTHRKLLMGDTGATKTASSYLAMEHVGAKRVTIFGPAKARATWRLQAEKHFNPGAKTIFTIEHESDLQNPLVLSADYVFVSNMLLARMQREPEKQARLIQLLVHERGTDGIIIDEAHTFKNEAAQGTTMLASLVSETDKRYAKLHPKGKVVPIIELTATPISNSIEDLDMLLGVLYPGRFALPGAATETKDVFSRYALDDPKLAYTLLFGEKLLIQWSSQDIFGSKIPELTPEREIMSLRPYERVIYEWVANVPIDPLRKINLLINLLLNPRLIKETALHNGWAIANIPPVDQLAQRFDRLYAAWEKWNSAKSDTFPNEPFSADWIAKFLNGDDFFLLHAFFSPDLRNGVFSLAEQKAAQDPSFARNWEYPEAPSTKFGALKDIIATRLQDTPPGKAAKFFVVSPFRRGAVTGNFTPEQESGMADMDSLYAQLKEWFPQVTLLRVDGTQSDTKRLDIAANWTADNTLPSICVASMQAVFESGDWAVKQATNTQEINVIFLGWPWGWDDFKQMSGRFLRPGLAVPVNITVLENDDTIDLGFQNLVRRKYLLTQMALFGVRLGAEDQQFFNESLAAGNI